MITRRLLIPFVCVVVGLAGRPAAADPAQDAQTFINDFSHRAIELLTEKNFSDAELIWRFKTLFEEGFDISYIARSALGRFWPRATDDEKAQYVPLFEDYVVTIYAGQFRDYTGQGFTTKSAQVGADGVTIVFSDIVSSDGPPTKLEWIIGDVDGKPKISRHQDRRGEHDHHLSRSIRQRDSATRRQDRRAHRRPARKDRIAAREQRINLRKLVGA